MALPGWDSLEFTSQIDRWSQWLAIALVLLAGVAQVVSLIYQTRHKVLERVATEAKDQERAEADAALAKELQAAKGTIEALRARQSARQLSPEQIGAFVSKLAKFGGQTVTLGSNMGDSEAEQLAIQLYKAFNAAGWQTRGPNLVMWSPQVIGAQMLVNPSASTTRREPPGLLPLAELLLEFGVLSKREIHADASVSDGEIELRIGAKPR